MHAEEWKTIFEAMNMISLKTTVHKCFTKQLQMLEEITYI